MKPFPILFLLVCLTLLKAQDNGIEQPSEITIAPTGETLLRWHGKHGRSYFIQVSDPTNHLDKWNWAPIIESGNNEEISYEVDGTADRGFFRLKHTDQPLDPDKTVETSDFDHDGISNIDEISPPAGSLFGQTDPLDGDTDHDDLPDGWEITSGLDPNDDGRINPDNGAAGDPDIDGSPNRKEFVEGTRPKNADDFTPEWVWTANRVDGTTWYSGSVPDEGYINYQAWNHFSIPRKDINEALQPTTVYDELLTIPFPDTVEEAILDPLGNTSRIGLEWASFSGAHASYYMTPENDDYGFSDATYVSSRSWLHVPPQPIPRQFRFLKTTYHSKSGYAIPYTHELTAAEVVVLEVPANQAYSGPFDLDTSTSAENGITHSTRVQLQQIRIVPDADMVGVVGDIVKSTLQGTIVKHFVTPRKNDSINQLYVELKAEGIEASEFSRFLEWEGGEPGAAADRRKVSRNTTGKTEISIKAKTGGVVLAKMIIWVVWADIATTPGNVSFTPYPNNAGVQYKIDPQAQWRFVFKIEPQALFNQTTADRPDLTGDSENRVPGAEKPYTFNPLESGDNATRKWDLSRQVEITIRNPGGVDTEGVNPAAWYVNQPLAEDTPVTFPSSDAEGNDDPPLNDEDGNPYVPSFRLSLEHEIGDIISTDRPELSLATANGLPDAYFAKELRFREFARLELWDGKRKNGNFWFRISNHETWHHYLRSTFNGTNSIWENTNSSSGVGH